MNIREVQLLTDDLGRTRRFYHEILGLEILSCNHGIARFSSGLSVLTFHQSVSNRPVYHFAFDIPCNQFDEAMVWAGSKFELIAITPSNCVADFKSWNAKAFYFYDNNQNIVELIARFDTGHISHQPFGSNSIYSISEIGMVVENPYGYAQGLLAKYNLSFFSKQKPTDDFIAVGNDDGLFIIVTENRNWYPTKIRSTRHWTKVTIQLPGRLAEITLNE